MTNERDTHFQGFAKLQWPEILHETGLNNFIDGAYINKHYAEWNATLDQIEKLLAQRNYDLVKYVMSAVPPIDRDWPTVREWEWDIHDIPDLTSWPDTSPQ